MFDHQKIILEKVRGNKDLFSKELKKSLKWLSPDEISKLYFWLKSNFWDSHKNEIETVFKFELA